MRELVLLETDILITVSERLALWCTNGNPRDSTCPKAEFRINKFNGCA